MGLIFCKKVTEKNEEPNTHDYIMIEKQKKDNTYAYHI